MDPLFSSAIQFQQDMQSFKIGASVLKKTMDVQKTTSEAILTLLDSAMVAPTGKSLGMGQNLDIVA
ncbi:MAG: putative motility protein [Thermoguttaceae bacterium]